MDNLERNEVDMHMHSTYSDGRNTVKELIGLVVKAKLNGAILTEHDGVGGLEEFISLCEKSHIDSMSGVEISSTDMTMHPQTIDVLGYGFNKEIISRDYNELLEHNLNVRIKYINKVLDMYRKNEVMYFTAESLRTHFNLPVKVANKYWIMRARAESLRGRVATLEDAIEFAGNELKKGGRYFAERENYISTKEAIVAIRQSGGLAIWAHPTKTMEKLEKRYENPENIFSKIIERMAYEGLDGLEIYTPYGHSHRKMLLNCADKYNLIVTGGSDYHGECGLIEDVYLGKGGLSYKEFLEIRERIRCLK
mgnify:CR=1 FL=1